MMNDSDKLCVSSIRVLAADMIEKAKSGHPGMPLGAAPMAYALFSRSLKFCPDRPDWQDRDRFVLSAGHGSALMYALLHIFGYDVTIEDIKGFRQLGSKTPGHPEYGVTPGVDVSTGPLGQGIANAVGMAMAEAHLAAQFNREGYPVVDHYTYALCGDGCLMEGISGEACSLAGTLKLGKLIVLYDSNNITIEGSTDTAFAEDVLARYAAYGWHTQEVEDGNDIEAISAAIEAAKAESGRPSIIKINTTIGFGSPKAGSASVHGAPLGADGVAALRDTLGFVHEPFTVPDEAYAAAKRAVDRNKALYEEYEAMMAKYAEAYPELAEAYKAGFAPVSPEIFDDAFYSFEKPLSTRKASSVVINRLADKVPTLFGGSADLGPSNLTVMDDRRWFSPENRAGSNVHFGVREFAMGAIANGLAVHGGITPYVATFFVFSDYMKHAARLSALMELPVIYVFTHDSIGVGEDGPTHQPIEQLAGLRAMPGMNVWRPADARETAAAYEAALTSDMPTAIVLSRQDLPLTEGTGKKALAGAYAVVETAEPDVILIGTGSELSLCTAAAEKLAGEGVRARVVSMPCMEAFEAQSCEYRSGLLPKGVPTVAVEAASSFGWHKYADAVVALDSFGASAPAGRLFEKYGITADAVAQAAGELLK